MTEDVLAGLQKSGRIATDWAEALQGNDPLLIKLREFLQKEENNYLPEAKNIFRAFEEPLQKVRVLIVGQDPYPTPGHAMGLAFSVEREIRPLPRSLKNIYKELETDLGIPQAEHGDLSSWSKQGVMLLNRVLTVKPGTPDSHAKKGWEEFTENAITALVKHNPDTVAILWGAKARGLKPLLANIETIESAHPSPLSASRGFFGSRPFSRANNALQRLNRGIIDWTV